MEVEHVAGIRLASRGTAEQQGHGAVGNGVLAEVVVDHQHVLALVHEFLGDGAGRVGRQILHGSRIRSRGRHHHAPLQGARLLKLADNARHRGGLLADGAVDGDDAAVLLVEHGGQGDGGLAGLAVADDELPLSPANGDHAVNGQDAGLHGGVHRRAIHDGRGGALHLPEALGFEGHAVQRAADGIHHPTQELSPHAHVGNASRAPHHGAGHHGVGLAKERRAHAGEAHVQRHAVDLAFKFQKLSVFGVGQSLHLDDAVLDGLHPAIFIGDHLGRESLQAFLEELADGNIKSKHGSPPQESFCFMV